MKQLLIALLVTITFTACSKQIVKDPSVNHNQTNTSSKQAQQSAQQPTILAPANQAQVNPLTDPNNILSKRSVYFDFDSESIKDAYRELIEAHAAYLMSHPDLKLRIEGNADDRGSHEYNLSLGQKRAVAIKKVMNLRGVQDRQIETISYGEEKPKSLGDNEISWSVNRRGDIVYSGE